MDVVETIKQANYALVMLSLTGRVTVEYFTDYPDLRLSSLANTTNYELSKQKIAAYALCVWSDFFWVTSAFRALTPQDGHILDTYIKTKLNKFN